MFPFDIHLSISKSKSGCEPNTTMVLENGNLSGLATLMSSVLSQKFWPSKMPSFSRMARDTSYGHLSRKHRQNYNNFFISVAFIKYKHNIVIPKEHGLVTNRQNHYSFTKHTQFPINLWPTSRTKHVTIIPILISNEFASVYISELENTINSLTSQAGCVEFLPISPAEVRSFINWIRIEPGKFDPFNPIVLFKWTKWV